MSIPLSQLLDRLDAALTSQNRIPTLQTRSDCHSLEAISRLMALLQHRDPAIIATTVELLIQLAPESVGSLLSEFNHCQDQNLQAQIVRILANIGDDQAIDLLVDMVGAEIANHCQGNVRRIAARGLGKMVTEKTVPKKITKAVDKLIWALLNTEDWALRYASAISLQEIAQRNLSDNLSVQIQRTFRQAFTQEIDPVVKERINLLMTCLDPIS